MMMRYPVRSQSAEADRLTGLKKSARAEMSKKGLLTTPFSIGGRAKAYWSDELESINNARAAGADDEAVRALVRKLMAARARENQAA